MKKRIEKILFDILMFIFGIFFVVLGVAVIINSFLYPEVASFLWFCYWSLILIGIGMIFKSSYLIVMQLNVILIPLIFWNVYFFYQLLSGKSLFGITDYFFIGGVNSFGNVATLQHVYILPLAAYAVYRFGIRSRGIWIASFIEVSVVFFLSFFFTSIDKNVNCAFTSCFDFIKISGMSYSLLWFFSMFIMVYLVDYLMFKFFYIRT